MCLLKCHLSTDTFSNHITQSYSFNSTYTSFTYNHSFFLGELTTNEDNNICYFLKYIYFLPPLTEMQGLQLQDYLIIFFFSAIKSV